MKKYFIISFILLFITSCNSDKNKVLGDWYISNILNNGKSVNLNLLMYNISFRKDNTCFLPSAKNATDPVSESKGTWEIVSENGDEYIRIHSSNHIFDKKFKMILLGGRPSKSTSNGEIKMTLESDKIKFFLTKYPSGLLRDF
ncbi:MAG: hypothetical protein ACTHNW_02995 [Mucilaginibacter sp.]